MFWFLEGDNTDISKLNQRVLKKIEASVKDEKNGERLPVRGCIHAYILNYVGNPDDD